MAISADINIAESAYSWRDCGEVIGKSTVVIYHVH